MQRTHAGALIKEGVSLLGVQCTGNWVLEGVSFAEFVVVMLRFIALLQVQVIVGKEMVVVLGANNFCLQFFLHVFVWVEISCLVLPKLIIVVFIIEVFGTYMCALSDRIAKLLQYFLKTCFRLAGIFLLVGCISVNF
jgi:hypothetical protein